MNSELKFEYAILKRLDYFVGVRVNNNLYGVILFEIIPFVNIVRNMPVHNNLTNIGE